MVEKLDPKSEAYKRNSALILALEQASDDSQRSQCLSNLANVLALNSYLSNKQQSMLMSTLQWSSILTYEDDFVNSGEDDADKVDCARWKIEKDADLQVSAIAVLARLNDPKITLARKIDLLATTLNRAHLLGIGEMYGYADDEQNKPNQNYLKDYENRVFNNRLILATELMTGQVVTTQEVELLEEIRPEEFRYDPQYDRLMILDFVHNMDKANTVLDRFKILQQLMYLGYAMARRDCVRIDKFFDDLYE